MCSAIGLAYPLGGLGLPKIRLLLVKSGVDISGSRALRLKNLKNHTYKFQKIMKQNSTSN
jgi:hypothetical protein